MPRLCWERSFHEYPEFLHILGLLSKGYVWIWKLVMMYSSRKIYRHFTIVKVTAFPLPLPPRHFFLTFQSNKSRNAFLCYPRDLLIFQGNMSNLSPDYPNKSSQPPKFGVLLLWSNTLHRQINIWHLSSHPVRSGTWEAVASYCSSCCFLP